MGREQARRIVTLNAFAVLWWVLLVAWWIGLDRGAAWAEERAVLVVLLTGLVVVTPLVLAHSAVAAYRTWRSRTDLEGFARLRTAVASSQAGGRSRPLAEAFLALGRDPRWEWVVWGLAALPAAAMLAVWILG